MQTDKILFLTSQLVSIKEIRDKQFFQQIIDRFANVNTSPAKNNRVLIFYQSELKKEGPIHTCIETFKL
jgi:hypothetical protein